MRLSIVIPFYNEEGSVLPLFARLAPVMDGLTNVECEVICVDDGSRDATLPNLLSLQAKDSRIQVISLSRNFGKEAALTAGLDHALGDAVMFMDGDLQHPPEMIPTFLGKLNEGWDGAYGVKKSRKKENPVYAAACGLFYAIAHGSTEVKLPRDAGDFRIISRRVADALRQMQERQRFLKGLFAWVGFNQTPIEYEVADRAHGKSSWSPLRLASFAWSGLISFTSLPLRVWSLLGLVIAVASASYAAWIVIDTMVNGTDLPGYPTIVTAIFFLGGVQLLSIGILGEYVARIFTETKQRPLYLVQDKYKLRRPVRARRKDEAEERSAASTDQ